MNPLIQASLYFMRTLGSGMGGMTHENDIRIAEGLQHMSLPDDPAQAMAAWRGAVNDAVTTWHRARDCDFPDLNDLERRRVIDPIGFASRTTSFCRSTAARRRTGFARSVLSRRCSRSGRSPGTRTTNRRASRHHPSRWRRTIPAGR